MPVKPDFHRLIIQRKCSRSFDSILICFVDCTFIPAPAYSVVWGSDGRSEGEPRPEVQPLAPGMASQPSGRGNMFQSGHWVAAVDHQKALEISEDLSILHL